MEIYDAALHLCVHTRSELPALAILGATPVAASGLLLLRQAQRGHSVYLLAALFCASLVFRLACQGAGAYAATRELEGASVGAFDALRQALVRLPSFVTATVGLLITEVGLFAISAGFSTLALPVQNLGPALIAEGSAHGWNFWWVTMRRMRGRGPAAFGVRLLHGLALLILNVNLHTSVLVTLALVHTFTGADVSFLSHFASPSHAFYDLVVFAVSAVLLDPIRCATMTLLLADARVRHEGFDLLSALQSLREAMPKTRTAASVLLALAIGLAPSFCRADDDDDDAPDDGENIELAPPTPIEAMQQLPLLTKDLGIDHEPEVRAGLAKLKDLSPEDRVLLTRLVWRLNGEVDAARDEDARQELRTALSLLGHLPTAAATDSDVRSVAQQVLASPDFDDELHKKAHAAEDEDDEAHQSYWDRFWKWLGAALERWLKSHHPEEHEPEGKFGIDASVAQWVTGVLVVLATGVIAVAAWQALRRKKATAGAPGGAGSGGGGEVVLDALSRPTVEWSDDADRLAAQGRFREAIRSLYLALLSSLHRRGAIDYHPALSNWDYCSAFRGGAEELPPFRELTLRFDFGWYGRLGADAPGYSTFKQLVAPLLGHGPPQAVEAVSDRA